MKRLITNFIQKSLSLENGSALDRKRTGYESARPLTVLTMLLVLFTFGVGNAWGTVPTTSGLNFGAPGKSVTFESCTTGTKVSNTNTSSAATYTNNVSGCDAFTYGWLAKANNGTQSIGIFDGSADNDDPMTSLYLRLTTTSNGGSASFTRSFQTTGAFSFKIAKSSKGTVGLYNGAAGTFAHNSSTACLSFDGGSSIKISAGTNDTKVTPNKWTQTVSSSLPSATVLEITVIYNTTGSGVTYGGGSFSLAANSAHVFINGTAVDDGEGNAKDFVIGGNAISHFYTYSTATSSNYLKIDDIKIYDALPTASGSCDVNPSVTAGSNNGSFLLNYFHSHSHHVRILNVRILCLDPFIPIHLAFLLV